MKKSLLVRFTFYFLLISIGVVYGRHDCGKKVSHSLWGVTISQSKACSCVHTSELQQKKCCKKNVKWIKTNSNASKTDFNFHFKKTEIVVPVFFVFIWNNIKPDNAYRSFTISHSPPYGSTPLYLKNRILLI